MSIEFNCSQCGKLLRVGDDAAGKQARCPSCGAVQEIPASTPSAQSPFGASAPAPAAGHSEVNPYQAPASAPWYPGTEPTFGTAPRGTFQPTPIDAGDILGRTFEIFKVQFWMITLAAFIIGIIETGFGWVVGQIATVVVLPRAGAPPTIGSIIELQVVVQIPNFLFSTWLQTGMAVYMLKLARGEPAELGDLFSGGRYWQSAIAAKFLYVLGVYIGFALLIVPGILVALMFSQYLYLIVDRHQRAIEALGESNMITTGNKLNIFVLGIATIGVSLLGLLACCVGIIPAAGFINLMWAVAYLAMTGQPTADALLDQPAGTPATSPFVPPSPEMR